MTQDSFHQFEWIKEETVRVSNERGIGPPRSFAAWALQFVNKVDLDDAVEQTNSDVNLTSLGIHGWHRDEGASELQIWNCTWVDDAATEFDATEGKRVLGGVGTLLSATTKLGPEYNALTKALRTTVEHDYDIVINVAVPTRFNKDAVGELDAIAIELETSHGCHISLNVFDAHTFEDLKYERNEVQESLKGHRVEFVLADKIALELKPPTIPTGWSAALANLSGASLAKVASDHGMRLFHMNVRFALPYQQKRVGGIRKTLASQEEAQYFWLYNNGLTILCDGFKIVTRPDGSTAITIENPQVVNGCQTVTAFKASADKFASSASVLARIISPAKNQAADQAALISERTNSQTPVLARDLKTNDKVQKLLHLLMRSLTPPWFYELKRGEWAALGVKQSEYQNGTRRLVDIEQLGQSYRMLYEPAESITRKRDLFEEDETYTFVFVRGRTPEAYLFPEILRQKFAAFWRKDNLAQVTTVCGDALDERILNRLMRAKNQVVSHCVALTGKLFEWSGQWSADQSRKAFAVVAHKRFDPDPWLRHIGIGLMGLVELIDAIAEANRSDVEPMSIKRYFERAGQKTLVELWKKISGNAQLLAGAQWRKQIMKQVSL